MQNVPQITSPIGQTAEEYASNLSPIPALNPVPGSRDLEIDPVPQVNKHLRPAVSSR